MLKMSPFSVLNHSFLQRLNTKYFRLLKIKCNATASMAVFLNESVIVMHIMYRRNVSKHCDMIFSFHFISCSFLTHVTFLHIYQKQIIPKPSDI